MLRSLLRLLALTLMVTGAAAAHDSEPINTEFAAPFALHAGNVQFGFQYLRDSGNYDAVPLDFEYGLASRMQFSISQPLTRLDQDGKTYIRPGNLEFAFRYLLAGSNTRKFALSVNPELGVPSGDKRVAEHAWEGGLFLHLDTHLVDKVWTHANIGYATPLANFVEKSKDFVYRFAVMYEAREWVRPVLELVGDHDYASGTSRFAVVPELIFAPNHHWEIKAGMPLGTTRETPDVGLQVQVAWKFGEGRR